MRLLASASAIALFLLFPLSAAEATTIGLDSTSAYLRTGEFDSALDAIPIELISLGLVSGDVIRLRIVGDFSYCGPLHPECDFDIGTFTTAVFSSTSSLLGHDQLHRVVGAIDAGDDVVTDLDSDGQTTDISEDFALDSFFDVFVKIPVGATHLFVEPADSFLGDNHDADGDYGVSITRVPEPSTLALLGAGLAAIAARWRRQDRG